MMMNILNSCIQRPVRYPIRRHRQNAAIASLNQAMDAYRIPADVNESAIECIVQQWERLGKCTDPYYWLLTARLFEMTLLCAGHYVDNCEYTLAGDLLFNPRKIEIYQKGRLHPTTKHRHARLSGQLKADCGATERFPDWFKRKAITRVTQPALLPLLRNYLAQSGQMTATYLKTVEDRLQQACFAIGFLNAWSISCAEDLHCRIRSASNRTKRFVERHLCHFDTALFVSLGKEIHLAGRAQHHQSELIAASPLSSAQTIPRRE